jgi:hypothetical protein
MSIRFACKCGKHLRAGDTMAGRHTLCPKCGALVAIPTAGQAIAGAASARPQTAAPDVPSSQAEASDDAEEIGPILLRVRRRNDKDPNQFRKSVWVPIDPDRGPPPEKLPKPVRTTRRRYNWQLETRWYQSLPYVLRARIVLSSLSVAQAGLVLWAAVLLPKINAGTQEFPTTEVMAFAAAATAAAIYTLGLFDCVLSSAAAGEYRFFAYPGADLGIRGFASCMLCFLAGPLLPALFGLIYWLRCGDPDSLDWIIIAESAGVTFAYWVFEIIAARETGAWLASPIDAASILTRLGPRSLVVAAGLPGLGYLYARLVLAGLVRWHTGGLASLPYLVGAQFTLVFGATFLLRVIGVWSYQRRPTDSAAASGADELLPQKSRSVDREKNSSRSPGATEL